MPSRIRAQLLACVVAACCAAGCKSPTIDPSQQVQEALVAANLRDVKVEYVSETKSLRLKGSVASQSDRDRALDVAMSAGHAASISNELIVTTIEAQTESAEDQIAGEVRRLLAQDRVLRRRGLGVEVAAGVVSLTGNVRTVAERNRAVRVTRSVPGVKRVINRLAVRPPAKRS
jgi:hyperosmotically inducible protein